MIRNGSGWSGLMLKKALYRQVLLKFEISFYSFLSNFLSPRKRMKYLWIFLIFLTKLSWLLWNVMFYKVLSTPWTRYNRTTDIVSSFEPLFFYFLQLLSWTWFCSNDETVLDKLPKCSEPVTGGGVQGGSGQQSLPTIPISRWTPFHH